MADDVIRLADLDASQAPRQLKYGYYFDFAAHPFAHAALFTGANERSVIDAIAGIHAYIAAAFPKIVADARGVRTKTQADFKGHCAGRFTVLLEDGAVFEPGFVVGGTDEGGTLLVAKGAKILGANLWLDSGNVAVGEATSVEPGVGIKGPCLIGSNDEIRQGSYFRGDVVIGNECTLRGEIKNTVVMDKANFPHPSYLGDSLCGYQSHFGNQATSANVRIFDIVERKNILVEIGGKQYDLGRRKVGMVIGDYSQVGCNAVSDPGVFLAPWVIVYALTRINKGFYGPNDVVKNKPLNHEVIERAVLRRNQ